MSDKAQLGRLWTLLSAGFGAIAWLCLAGAFAAGLMSFGVIELLFSLAPLVIVPLGFHMISRFDPAPDLFSGIALSIQPLGAFLAVGSFWLPAGNWAALLASPWLVFCVLAAWDFRKVVGWRHVPSVAAICFLLARFYQLGGAVWLVVSRAGAMPMGFGEPIVLLTAVHFHFAGFATAVLVGATAATLKVGESRKWSASSIVFLLVAVGPALVAGGFMVSPLARMAFAVLLCIAVLSFAGISVGILFRLRSRLAQLLLGVGLSAGSLAMLLAAVYAVGDYTGTYWLLIPQMARWHGTLNGLGFCLCGLLAWVVATAREGAQ